MFNKRNIILLLIGVLLILGGYLFLGNEREDMVRRTTEKAKNVVTGSDGFSFDESTPGYETYKELAQGCPTKDCIPSIDSPNFETIDEADTWLNGQDIVFVLEYEGSVKAYPQRIMNWHEIVNDKVDGNPVVSTFCPLCGSALAFSRSVNSMTLEFGVSGKLHNNDLVMYDRKTESLWQQITGKAIVGKLEGEELEQIPMSGMRWEDFKEEFGRAQVLSRDTGYSRSYDSYPYGSYESDRSFLFPVEGGADETIHPKTVVYGVVSGDEKKAYTLEDIREEGEIRDSLGGERLVVTYNNGDVTVENRDSEIPATRLFWFAWKAFNPDTKLY